MVEVTQLVVGPRRDVARFDGVLKCDTLIGNAVVVRAAPGAGDVWWASRHLRKSPMRSPGYIGDGPR